MLGVVGGVGPAAGVDLVQKIHAQTLARQDQDHLPVLLASLPAEIPDRTEFLLGRSPSNPVQPVGRVLSLLASAGASVVGIPCNTLHARSFFPQLRSRAEQLQVELIDMIVAVRDFIAQRLPDARLVGVLCTLGTAKSRVYSDVMADSGIEVVYPDEEVQEACVHRAIYDPTWGVKACSQPVSSTARQRLSDALAHLARKKVQCVILGCTELPLRLRPRAAATRRSLIPRPSSPAR